MADEYDIGDTIRLAVAFTNRAGADADPTTVRLITENPEGTQVQYTHAAGEITKDATGHYYKDITLDLSGVWYYHWLGTGAVATSEGSSFEVRENELDDALEALV